MTIKRDDIVAAIRAGADTSKRIADALGIEDPQIVSEICCRMRDLGRLSGAPGEKPEGEIGRPKMVWSVNEGWRSRRGRFAPEISEKFSEAMRARRADPEFERKRRAANDAYNAQPRVEVPQWVKPPTHRKIYRAIAPILGEEAAAQWARAAKRQGSVDVGERGSVATG